jgi:hypothetical protein
LTEDFHRRLAVVVLGFDALTHAMYAGRNGAKLPP